MDRYTRQRGGSANWSNGSPASKIINTSFFGVKNTFWIKISGIWKTATAYIKIAGIWKQADPKTKVSSIWK